MILLDPRLESDTLEVGDFALCRLLLMNDSAYPWFILVPRLPDAREIHRLKLDEQQQLWQEITEVVTAMDQVFMPDKMNVANLGNVVSQLHVHVVARYEKDRAWPGPVWGRFPAVPYETAAARGICMQLVEELSGNFRPGGFINEVA